jgi:GrpB-like predicted nucleotidyltransferase (UPF0157 family)
MHDDAELLSLRDDSASARRSFARIAADVSSILPGAEIEHVGATAVSGCLTKGDLDVLVRVTHQDFPLAMRTLDAVLRRGERNDPTSDYVEYDCGCAGCSASVQLVVAGCWHDRRFRQLKSVLESDAAALARYNELKRRHEGHALSDYGVAKSAFIDELLGV